MKLRHLLLPGFLLLAPAAFLHAQMPRYVVIDLGTLEGGYSSQAFGINNAGQVTGGAPFAGGHTSNRFCIRVGA